MYKLGRPSQIFYKMSALKIFAKFKGKHVFMNFAFNKVAGLKNIGKFGQYKYPIVDILTFFITLFITKSKCFAPFAQCAPALKRKVQ